MENTNTSFFKRKIGGKLPVWIALLILAVFIAAVLGFVTAEHADSENDVPEEEVRAVRVMDVSATSNDHIIYYMGTVQPKTTYQATYAGIAKVLQIYVTEGQSVSKGQKLARVEAEDRTTVIAQAEEALNQAKAAQITAKANYDKAVSQHSEYKKLISIKESYESVDINEYENAKAKQNNGEALSDEEISVISAYEAYTPDVRTQIVEYEDIAVNNGYPRSRAMSYFEDNEELTKALLDTANASVENAQTIYNDAKSGLGTGIIYSTLDGYVVMIYTEVGGIANPITPVVVVASNESQVIIGVSPSDKLDLRVGQECDITVRGNTYPGTVVNIGAMPDTTSRTYEVKISLPEDISFMLGDVASVRIHAGERIGVWLPLNCILNDGDDYVYIVDENDRAMKKYIKIEEISNDYVCVSGLEDGGRVVIDGMRYLSSGIEVVIVD